jgi:hypothetical protein
MSEGLLYARVEFTQILPKANANSLYLFWFWGDATLSDDKAVSVFVAYEDFWN